MVVVNGPLQLVGCVEGVTPPIFSAPAVWPQPATYASQHVCPVDTPHSTLIAATNVGAPPWASAGRSRQWERSWEAAGGWVCGVMPSEPEPGGMPHTPTPLQQVSPSPSLTCMHAYGQQVCSHPPPLSVFINMRQERLAPPVDKGVSHRARARGSWVCCKRDCWHAWSASEPHA